MIHNESSTPMVINALHDLGMAGIVLLILACGVLVLAFTRNFRTATSVTLTVVFLLAVTGWIFQVDNVTGHRRATAGAHEQIAVRMDEAGHAGGERSQQGQARGSTAIGFSTTTGKTDSATTELLRLTLVNASEQLAVYEVQGPLAAKATQLVDRLVAAANPGYTPSLVTAEQRIYSRTEASDGSQADQVLTTFVLTRQSARATFGQPPSGEQLEQVRAIVGELTASAPAKLEVGDQWSGTGLARTLALRPRMMAEAATDSETSAAPPLSPLDWDPRHKADKTYESAPEEPPAWMALADQPGRLVEGAFVQVASSGRFLTVEQCEPSLRAAIAEDVREYVRKRLGPEAEQLVIVPPAMIDEQIVRVRPYEESVASSTVEGGGKRLHALLVFDQKVQEQLKALYHDARIERRAFSAVAVAAAVVLMLAAVYGYLKANSATSGAYQWQLRAAALLVLGLAGTGLILAVQAATSV